jgi:mitogen-activated protein kinase 1/3
LDPDYFEFDDHKEDLTKADLKELLYEEILSFVPSI